MSIHYLDRKNSSPELDWASAPDSEISQAGSPEQLTASYLLLPLCRRVDTFLRQRQSIFEFCHNPLCLLRIALRPAELTSGLPEGLPVQPGGLVGELHLWNEHIPPIPADGPNLAWARLLRERMFKSFALLAASVRHEPRFQAVNVFTAKTRLGGDRSRTHFERLMKPFGFERIADRKCRGWREQLSGIGECLHLWGLLWVFNPVALTHHRLIQLSFRQLWMSRQTLLEKYPEDSIPGPNGPPGGLKRRNP